MLLIEKMEKYFKTLTKEELLGEVVEKEEEDWDDWDEEEELKKEREQIKVYTSNSHMLSRIKGNWDVFGFILMRMNESNRVKVDLEMKEKIVKEKGVDIDSIDIILDKLVTKDIICRLKGDIIMFNPFLFWKGHYKKKRGWTGKKYWLKNFDSDIIYCE